MARRSAQAAAPLPTNSQSSTSDAEGDDSQRVSALSSLLQTPRTNHRELQDFKTKVAYDHQQLKALLEQRTRQAEEASTRRRHELTEAIVYALQTPNRPVQGTPPTLGETKIARSAAFRAVAGVLTASEHLIGEYDRLDKMIVEIEDTETNVVVETWAKDVEKTDRLLKIGAESAIRNLQKVLGADVQVEETKDLGEGDERLDGAERTNLSYSLHTSLLYAEKGVRKMVKSLSLAERQ